MSIHLVESEGSSAPTFSDYLVITLSGTGMFFSTDSPFRTLAAVSTPSSPIRAGCWAIVAPSIPRFNCRNTVVSTIKSNN